MDRTKIAQAVKKALEDKGKRKFSQSVELIINMRSIDFSKSENRLNLDIILPKGKGGKELKSAVFAEGILADQAKKGGADLVISSAEIPAYADKTKAVDLAENYFLLADPKMMGAVAKSLGQFLGKRGKLPRPVTGNIADMIRRSKNSVRIVSKGRYLPTVQTFIGTETMDSEDLVENAEVVYETVKNKVKEGNIKSVFVKLTMGKPARI